MSIRVERQKFLQALELVVPGISPREVIDQSSCFIFRNGKVETFNDEIYCVTDSTLGEELTAAVAAEPLLALLRKLPDEELRIFVKEGSLRVKGKGREAALNMESKILLDVGAVEEPEGDWNDLPPEFLQGIELVEQCTSKDQASFHLSCVHLAAKWVEASDSFQAARFRVKMGIETPCLVRRPSLKHVLSLGMIRFAESPTWIHFQSPDGMRLSCRRFMEKYPDLSDSFKMEGETIQFPKSLPDALSRSEIFASETSEEVNVEVSLEPGRVIVEGQGSAGWYRERRKMVYDGPSLSFLIAPKLLSQIVQDYPEAIVSVDKLSIKGGRFSYVTCLGVRGERDKEDNDDAGSDT